MGRGRYPARLKVDPPPPELAERYLFTWRSRELYAQSERFPSLTAPTLFGDERPLELDIGCATGDLVLAMARLRPEANYLGLDIVAKPVWRAVERAAEAEVSNVKFIQADARLVYRLIPANALRAAYVHFPAPLLASRQRNQLLISPTLLATMERALIPGGVLSIMTDNAGVWEALNTLLPDAPGLRLAPPEQWSVTMTELLKSHYHRRWEARGRQIWRAELRRAGS